VSRSRVVILSPKDVFFVLFIVGDVQTRCEDVSDIVITESANLCTSI